MHLDSIQTSGSLNFATIHVHISCLYMKKQMNVGKSFKKQKLKENLSDLNGQI